jgi:ABC-2 type transport system ATP-binding protein
MSVIKIDSVSKSYGSIKAIDNFSLSAESGELLALVGPDGAGKTTLFRSICGLVEIDQGAITIAGFNISRDFDQVKTILGYMPQNFSLYPDLSVEENINFYAGLFGIQKELMKAKRERLYDFSGLGPFADRRAGKLSGGMKQKLALSCNLIHDPEVLILDEPTTGVDPLSRKQFWEILKSLKASGSTILVSTPYMDEVVLADRAVFIYEGHFLAEGTPEQLRQKFRGEVFRVKSVLSPDIIKRISSLEGVDIRRFGSLFHIYIEPDYAITQYYDNLAQFGISPENISHVNPDLEDTFIQLMEN